MGYSIDLWVEYLLRFSHLVAGIYWIGSSFYFIWLDSAFQPPIVPKHNVDGEVFMLHGGFYYQVEKRKIAPGQIPDRLHWFRWEATFTWLTGFALLIFVYYLKGASLLIDSRIHELTQMQAIAISLATILIAWIGYDLIWNKKLIRSNTLSTLLSVVFFTAVIGSNFQLFSGRGAFIQTGVIFGTLMLLNVWVRILPGQARMLTDAKAGKIPDYSESLKSKLRSVHNTYFIFPVLFIMLSNHYSTVTNHPFNYILLIIIAISGAMARHAMVTKRPVDRLALIPTSIGILALVFITAKNPTVHSENDETSNIANAIAYSKIKPIIQSRCLRCHSTKNTDQAFREAPKGIIFESENQLIGLKNQIRQQTINSRAMPLGNLTQMTEEERLMLKNYLDGIE